MALLACVGVDQEEEGFREVFLAVEVAGSEKGAAYASLLRGVCWISEETVWGAPPGGL